MARTQATDFQTEATLLDQVPILGRKAELRQLIKALTLCRSGQGKAILLTGNEGIGKSALLSTFLELAETHYASRAIVIPMPAQVTPQLLFAQIVEEILGMSQGIIHQTLQAANRILQQFDLRWGQSDLVRVIALMRLQESVGSRQGFAVDQLTQAIYEGIPFFKRRSPQIREQIQELAEVLFDPWVTLAVSLVNPINPQVQKALSLVKQSLGGPENRSGFLLTQGQATIPLLTASTPPAEDAAIVVSESRKASEEEDAEILEEFDAATPTINSFQQALTDLLVFINSGLRQQQTAFILAFEQWESVEESPVQMRKDLQDFLNEVLRQTVEQRDFRLMMVLTCRSEAESYAVGGTLYNALRSKYLVSPLAGSAQQRFLKDRFKAMAVTCEEPVIEEILGLCGGNPAWLSIVTRLIETDLKLAGLTRLDTEIYHERFAVRSPADLLEMLYTRLQLSFVGEESESLKALAQLITHYGSQAFTLQQALKVQKASKKTDASPD